jgi:nucleotide-binding universal stress UspA family protein
MEPFKRILVDIDATATTHPALERAAILARSSGAKLTITDVMTVPPNARHYLPPGVEENMARDRQQRLAGIARGLTDVYVESKFLVGRPATVLIEEVLRSSHDLLMRSHARDLTAAGPKPFGAADMELLRKCPCPVLLVRHGRPAPQPQIAGAVNASTESTDEEALNVKIVESALSMAEHLGSSSVALLHAWAPFAERAVRSHSSDDGFAVYLEGARQQAAADLARLIQSFESRLVKSHAMLRRGAPEDVIPEFVVAEGIELLVMGTVARGGIAGMFLGNTAEQILRKLPCSVLAVKPDGFVSPIRISD